MVTLALSADGHTGPAGRLTSVPAPSTSLPAPPPQPAAANTNGSTCSPPARRNNRAATANVHPESV